MIRKTFAAAAALAIALSSHASAHTFWLQPEAHEIEVGENLRVDFKVGDAGDVSDWGLYWERIGSLRLYTAEGRADLQGAVRTTSMDDPGTARLSLEKPGTHILAFESNPSFSDLEAERFNNYLDHEGLTAIANHRAATGTAQQNGSELYARRAKTLLQVGDELSNHVTKPIGHTLEIVPLTNPFALEPGEKLEVSVLWRGRPLAGALVHASALGDEAETVSYTTDADGRAMVSVAGDAATLVNAVWGVPAPKDARADYFTIFASLTF